jgi:hypothetical protein
LALDFKSFSAQKKSRKLAGGIGRLLRKYKILQILSQHFILGEKAKVCSQKILQFSAGVRGGAGVDYSGNFVQGVD